MISTGGESGFMRRPTQTELIGKSFVTDLIIY